MALAHAPGHAAAGRPGQMRSTRRMLRSEKAQLAHWRRLLRARLDLAVAGVAPPEPLGALNWDLLPEALLHLPGHEELSGAVTIHGADDTVDLLTRLRELDRSLARYAEQVDAALARSDEEVLRALADGPDTAEDDPA
jgi:hypothetical protein